jgi:anti-sigma B factor antagonist
MDLAITLPRETRGTWLLTAEGEIDIASAPRLRDQLLAALGLEPALPVTLDMAGVTFLDSTGLAALVEVHRLAGEGGRRLCLLSPRRSVRRILHLTQLDALLEVHSDLDAALTTLQPLGDDLPT